MIIQSRSHLADIFKLTSICLREVQRAEVRFAIAFPPCVADNCALQRLSRFDFQPAFAALSRQIGAMALFGHDALETRFFNGIFKPLPSPCQRLIDDRTSIQIKTVEQITHCGMFGPGTFNSAFGFLLHAMDDISEIWFSIGVEADNFSVEKS